MVSRGEVALIVTNKGMAVGLLGTAFFGLIVIMVIVTTILTSILLKFVFKESDLDSLSHQDDAFLTVARV